MSEAGGQGARTRVLALCGSLRAASINAALLRAAARVAPPGIDVTLFASLGDLPLFNPDLEPAPPAAVLNLRRAVAGAVRAVLECLAAAARDTAVTASFPVG